MSLVHIRPYFRARMNALGFREWTDAFNIENIPSNILDRSYHIESNSVAGDSIHMEDQELNGTVNIKVFIKGYRTPADAVDKAMEYGDSIITECCKASNRLVGNLKNVVLNSLSIEPLALTNDNSAILTIAFNVFTILDVEA